MEFIDNLKDHIGEKVIVYFYHGDLLFKITQELKVIDEYTNITVGNQILPFINKVSGIGTVTLPDNTIIYKNPEIYEGYSCANDEELDEIKKKMYGNCWRLKLQAHNKEKHTVKPKNVN